jgi:hypothetical protein
LSEFFQILYTQVEWLISQNELAQAMHLSEQMLALAEEQAGLPLER